MATKTVPDDLSYYIPVDICHSKKKRNLPGEESQQRKRSIRNTPSTSSNTATTTTPIITSKQLAQEWLLVHRDPPTKSDLLTSMVRLKRQLLFSIDIFVMELDIASIVSSTQLRSLLQSYHTWSQHAQNMMPLISVILPLLLHDKPHVTSPPQTQNHTTAADHLVANCLRDVNNTKVSQDYLEAIISYQSSATPSIKTTLQNWINTLFEQDRLGISRFLTSDAFLQPLDLYLDYFDLLNDKLRLNSLSWEDRKTLVEKEWISWATPLEHQKHGDIQAWLSLKSESLQNKDGIDLDIDSLMDKNVAWLSDWRDSNSPAPNSSTMIDFLMNQYTEQKIPNMRMMYGIFGKHCQVLMKTGQESTGIVKILEHVRQLLLHHLQGSADLIALLLSMVQITLHHMDSILTYTEWFKSTFIDPNTTILKSKRQFNLWIKHLETMIPYETTTVLQIHAKSLNDARHLQVAPYISSVKSKLLALGMDATLRNYPTHLGIALVSDPLRQPSGNKININDGTSSNSTIMGHQPTDMEKMVKKYGETRIIPQSLWEDSIFRPKWFKQTFLPALMIDWKPTDTTTLERRTEIVLAFQQKGKVPPSLMAQFSK